ncbi:hypothetical protein Ciccas_007787 [Cichlidogyrus casuarinus]|uniref:Uncharacterized protein n=1 Tax=Cichlidogyrus casuarinus TaxID=1844966 RepID=A0ABD2Q1V7_9PLAT
MLQSCLFEKLKKFSSSFGSGTSNVAKFCPLQLRELSEVFYLFSSDYMNNLENLLNPPSSADIVSMWNSRLFALHLIISLLEDFSQQSSIDTVIPLHMRLSFSEKFQDSHLLTIFKWLLQLTVTVIDSRSKMDTDLTNLLEQLISALDLVFQWNFVTPQSLHSPKNDIFRPCASWSSVLDENSLPNLLVSLQYLYSLVRANETIATKVLSSLVRISTLKEEFIGPEVTMLLMHHFNCWLSPQSSFTEQRIHMLWPNSDHKHLFSLLQQWDPGNLMAQSSTFWLLPAEQLTVNELANLSEYLLNLSFRLSEMCNGSEFIAFAVSNVKEFESATASLLKDERFLKSVRFVGLFDRFFNAYQSVFKRTLLLECSLGCLETLRNIPSAIHESGEKLASIWISLLEWLPTPDHPSERKQVHFEAPLDLTKGSTDLCHFYEESMQKLIHELNMGINGKRTELFQVFLMCRLSSPEGVRDVKTDAQDRLDYDDECCSIDLTLDEPDEEFFEGTLFTIGNCALSDLDRNLVLLCSQLEKKLHRLPLEDSVALLEDIHWLLLTAGHVIVRGPNNIQTLVKQEHSWTADYSLSTEIISQETADLNPTRDCLMKALQGASSSPIDPDQCLPTIRCLASVFRLCWLQAQHGIGSGQILSDAIWFLSRFFFVFLSESFPEVSDARIPFFRWIKRRKNLFRHSNGMPSLFLVLHGDNFGEKHDSDDSMTKPCIQAIIQLCKMILAKWHHDQQVMDKLSILLLLVTKYAREPIKSVNCESWFQLSEALLVCEKPETNWNRLNPSTLTRLMVAVLRGCWRISPNWSLVSDTPFHKVIDMLSYHFDRLFLGDNLCLSTLDSETSRNLVSLYQVLLALCLSFSWLFANQQMSPAVITKLWQSIMFPALQKSLTLLELVFGVFTDLVQSILRLFCNFADSALVHVAARMQSCEQVDQFLQMLVKLTDCYTKRSNVSTCLQQDGFIDEMKIIFKLHNNLALREYELRVYELDQSGSTKCLQSTMETQSSFVVDHILCSLANLLPIVNAEFLAIPELAQDFFQNWHLAVQLNTYSLCRLSDEQLELFFKVFSLALYSCSTCTGMQVDLLTILGLVASSSMKEQAMSRLAVAFRLQPSLHTSEQSLCFLQQLFSLIIMEKNPREIAEALQLPLYFSLINHRDHWSALCQALLYSVTDEKKPILQNLLQFLLTKLPQSKGSLIKDTSFPSAYSEFCQKCRLFLT